MNKLSNLPRSPCGLLLLNCLYPRRSLLLERHFQARHARFRYVVGDAVEAGRRYNAASARIHILKYARVIIYAVSIGRQRAWGRRVWRCPANSLLNQRTPPLVRLLIVGQVLVETALRRQHTRRLDRYRCRYRLLELQSLICDDCGHC